MSDERKPGDPADKAADGAFGGVQSHRAGYGDDRLQRLTEWLRAHPTATLAAGEGALLLAENDRLRARCRQIDDEAYDYAEQIEQLKAAAKDSARAERILAALREPSKEVWGAALKAYNEALFATHTPRLISALLAAVAAAEQEVGRE